MLEDGTAGDQYFCACSDRLGNGVSTDSSVYLNAEVRPPRRSHGHELALGSSRRVSSWHSSAD